MKLVKMKYFSKGKGFTLIELVVVTFIIGLMTALLLTNYKQGEKEFALTRSAYLVSQGMAKAQEMSVSAKEFSCPGGTTVPEGGYGVFFYNSSGYTDKLFIFADCNEDQTTLIGGEEIVETISLETGIKLKEFYVDEVKNDLSTVFTFVPPDPDVCIYMSCDDYNSTRIIISLESDPAKTKTITLNKVGLIEIE